MIASRFDSSSRFYGKLPGLKPFKLREVLMRHYVEHVLQVSLESVKFGF